MWRLVNDPDAVAGIGYIMVVTAGTCWLFALLGWFADGYAGRMIRRLRKGAKKHVRHSQIHKGLS